MSTQPDIKHQKKTDADDASIAERIESLDLNDEAEAILSDLLDEIEQANAIAETATKVANRSMQKANDLRDEVEELRDQNRDLERELADLQNRTSLLDTVQASTENVVEKRASVLIQTLYNEAWQDKGKDHLENVHPRASMDYNGAKKSLGGTVKARQQLYDAMREAVRLVHGDDLDDDELDDDEFVVRFIKESRSSNKNTRLVIDLEDVDELEMSSGNTITPPGGE